MKTKHFNLPQAKIMIAAAILCAPINMSAQESEKNSKEEGIAGDYMSSIATVNVSRGKK